VVIGVPAVAVSSAGCTGGGFEGVQESVLGAEERGEIVETYDQGVSRLNDANETRDEGIIAFNEERYGESIETLETSIDHYEGAEEKFSSAAEMAEGADIPPAAGICSEAATHVERMRQSTVAARKAASAAEAGESPATINGHTETSQELQAEAKESTVADPETLLEVLEAEK
jgi:hypothetical protein